MWLKIGNGRVWGSVAIFLLCCVPLFSFSQNTSNKGTDFWVGYMGHIDGTGSNMKLYITSDSNTTGTITIPGQSWSSNFSVTANTVTLVSIPPATAYVGCSDCTQDRGIHVVSVLPVVVYSHIHANARSDATLVLPTATLGREYLSMNYTQTSQGNNLYNQFMVVGVEDSTSVEITPTANSLSNIRTAGNTFTISLNKGQAYQYQSTSDLTGSSIVSVSSGQGGCKRIAVFSGSSFTVLGCGSASSGDNLYQQLYPVSAWGKEFITAPFRTRTGGDMLRVLAGTNSTAVYVNSTYVATLQKGQYYDFSSANPTYVKATQPVTLAQYQRTQNCDNVTGDPSMIIISPIEQKLNAITLYSSPYQNIVNHSINIIMKAADTASFRLDGNHVFWKIVTVKTQYAYAQEAVSSGNHQLLADSGFNAVAYGFGNVESYGYSAGANIKNLNQFVSLSTAAVCVGRTTNLIANTTYTPAAYKWYIQDTLYSTAASPSILFNQTGTYKLSLVTIKSNQNDCESQDSSALTFSVYASPSAKYTVSPHCQADSVFFYDSSSVTAPAFIKYWRWEFGDSTFSALKNSYKIYDSAYNYTVKLIVTTNNGCVDTLVKSQLIYPKPAVKFSLTNACYKDTAYFTDSTTIKSGAVTQLTWNFGDTTFSNQQNPVHYYKYADTFDVKLVALSDKGCTDSSELPISIYPRPVARIFTTNICHRDSAVFIDTSTVANSSVADRNWYFAGNFIGKLQKQGFTPPDTGTYTIKLWLSNNPGCSDSTQTSITIYPKPDALYSAANVCYTDVIIFKDSSKISKGTINGWNWHFGDGDSSALKIPNHKYAIAGTYNYSVTITSDKGCADTFVGAITAFPMPVVNFSTTDVCVYDSAVFNDSSSVGFGTISNRKWTFGNGYSAGNYSAVAHRYNSPSDYYVFLTVTANNLCKDSVFKKITIYPKPVADFTFNNVCVNTPAVFQDSSYIMGGLIQLRDWSLAGTFDTIINPVVTYNGAGNKTVSLTITSDFGCKDTAVKSITIYPAPSVNFTAPDICLRDSAYFRDSSTISSGANMTWLWDFGDTSTAAQKKISHYYSYWGTYSVKLTVTSDQGCIDSARKNVEVNPIPVAALSALPDIGCRPFETVFDDISTIERGTIDSRFWKFGNKDTSSAKTDTTIYFNAGLYSPELLVVSDKGCRHDSVFKDFITVNELPVARFIATPDSVSFFTPEIVFTDSSSADAIRWDWDLGDSTYTDVQNPVHEYADTGKYYITLVVRNQQFCYDTARKRIFITPDYTFFLPNAFTPNADDLNTTFGPEGIFKGVIYFHMEIFNRWGETLFTSDKLADRWDGRFKGEICETGNYFYTITIQDYFNNKKHFKGSILLYR